MHGYSVGGVRDEEWGKLVGLRHVGIEPEGEALLRDDDGHSVVDPVILHQRPGPYNFFVWMLVISPTIWKNTTDETSQQRERSALGRGPATLFGVPGVRGVAMPAARGRRRIALDAWSAFSILVSAQASSWPCLRRMVRFQ